MKNEHKLNDMDIRYRSNFYEMFQHGGHIEHIEISFQLKHRVIVLDLRLNTNIISRNFKQIYHENGKERIIQPSLRVSSYLN